MSGWPRRVVDDRRDPPRFAVVDYGAGNLVSIEQALRHVGGTVMIVADADELAPADCLIVPGVGAAGPAMARLTERGLVEPIRAWIGDGRPFLGICLGMQLLFEGSDELEPTNGLGLIGGVVSRLEAGGMRIPHIGWNEVSFERPSPLTSGLPAGGCPFYHVHSLVARPRDPEDVIGTTVYGERFATIVVRGSVLGVQFHPEKSSTHGLRMLEGFVGLCAEGAARRSDAAAVRA